MKQVVLGTAGHIDHGKTSLIKALTGIDTDRLKEEKARGITIELGFAHLQLPGGDRLGIVDVPGHERFVKHMVAGATGIDLVALVVAADEGVMPQTREHLEICELLRVQKGLVVLTKIDMVEDPDWIEMVIEDLREFLHGTFLDGAPLVAVSSVTGDGIDELRKTLGQLVADVEPRSTAGPFRLSIDRVFSMRGFGTVITGTSISGRLQSGDLVTLYPPGKKAKVIGLQVHNVDVSEVLPGQRTAINLQGMDRAAVQRGDVVATPGSLLPSHMVDVQVELLASAPKPLKNRTKVRFHTGTSENLATIVLLEGDELAPGKQTFAQIRLDRPLAVLRQDRFVLRSYSPVETIGGGVILHPVPRKHKGQEKAAAVESLRLLRQGDDAGIVLWHIEDAAWQGISENELRIRVNVANKTLQRLLKQFVGRGKILLYDKDNRLYISAREITRLQEECLQVLAAYHRQFPLKVGMPKEELAVRLPRGVDAKLYNFILRRLVQQNQVVLENEWVRLTSHKVDLNDHERKIREQIEEIYRQAGLSPPFFRDVVRGLSGNERQHLDVLQWMLTQNILLKVKEDLYYHRDAIEELKGRLISYLKEHGEIAAPQFKELTQTSRKYAIPLLEFMDAQKVTIRVGDVRRLRDALS